MANSRRILYAIGLILASIDTLAKADLPGQKIYKNPVEISSYNLMFTKIKANGREALALIDSGSSRPIEISSTLARELNISLTEDKTKTIRGHDGKPFYLSNGHLQTLAIGDYVTRNVDIEVAGDHIDNIVKQVKTGFEVILGWTFLSQSYVLIDYKNLILQFSDTPIEFGDSSISIGYSVTNNVPIVKGVFEIGEVNLLFDTGAPMCNIDAEYVNTQAGDKVSREISLGGHTLALEWRVKDLSVIRTSLGSVGVIGNNLLNRYAVYFDTKKKVIHLF